MTNGRADPADRKVRAAIASSHLRSLPDELVAKVVARARLDRFPAGTVIRREGERDAHLDLVVSGLTRAYVTAPDGRTLTVRYVRAGGLFGAVSLFTAPFALPATIQAVTASQLLKLHPDTVRHWADLDVRVARALIDELSERIMSFVPEIPTGAFATVRQRVARHLLDLASTDMHDDRLVARASQQELADAVGTVREVVVRALRQLREAALIQTGREGITILAPERLAAEAYGWRDPHRAPLAGTQVPDMT